VKYLIYFLSPVFILGCSTLSNENTINNELDIRSFVNIKYCEGGGFLKYSYTASNISAECSSGSKIGLNFRDKINEDTLNKSVHNFELFKDYNGCPENNKFYLSDVNISSGGDYPHTKLSSKGRCSNGSKSEMNIDISAKKSIFTSPMPLLLNNLSEYLRSTSDQLCSDSQVKLKSITDYGHQSPYFIAFTCDGSDYRISTDVSIDTIATYATLDCPQRGFKKFNAAKNNYNFECK